MFYSCQNDVRMLGDKVFNVLNDLKDFKVWIGFFPRMPDFQKRFVDKFRLSDLGFSLFVEYIFGRQGVALYLQWKIVQNDF